MPTRQPQTTSVASEAAPEIDPREPVALSELIFENYTEPRFPRGGGLSNMSGWVDLEFRVGTDGKTRNIEVIGSNLPERFEAPSIAAVKKWRFEPYLSDGQPAAVYSAVRLRFEQ